LFCFFVCLNFVAFVFNKKGESKEKAKVTAKLQKDKCNHLLNVRPFVAFQDATNNLDFSSVLKNLRRMALFSYILATIFLFLQMQMRIQILHSDPRTWIRTTVPVFTSRINLKHHFIVPFCSRGVDDFVFVQDGPVFYHWK
jgi:hypothetical protein